VPADPEIFDDYVRQRVRREFSPRGLRRDPLPSSLFISPYARIPGYGVLGDVLETGYGVGLHAFFPLSRAVYTSDRSAWFYGIETGFDYTYFEGKKGVNVNVPGGVDSIVHNADMYLFDLGLALCNARLVADSNLVWFNSVALKGVIGGIAVDMAANEFDPLDKQVTARSPREDAFLRGGRLEWKSGLLLPNGYTLSAFGSGDFHSTTAVVGHNQRTGFWTVGASLEIPTMPLRRAMSANTMRDSGTLLLGGWSGR
jgi:hypothetical protein